MRRKRLAISQVFKPPTLAPINLQTFDNFNLQLRCKIKHETIMPLKNRSCVLYIQDHSVMHLDFYLGLKQDSFIKLDEHKQT